MKRELNLILRCAHLFLENGGETYRAEEIAEFTARGLGVPHIDVLAIPTGVFVTITDAAGDAHSALRRTKRRSTNLALLDRVNDLSRRIVSGAMTLPEAERELDALTAPAVTDLRLPRLAATLSSGFFALLFGGGMADFAVACLCGFVVQWIAILLRRQKIYSFIVSLAGGMTIACFALLTTELFHVGSMESIVAGAMMPLLPGLLMTNGVRDTMNGDLVSGVARTAEAVLIAVALAAGAGCAIWLFGMV